MTAPINGSNLFLAPAKTPYVSTVKPVIYGQLSCNVIKQMIKSPTFLVTLSKVDGHTLKPVFYGPLCNLNPVLTLHYQEPK